MQQFVFFATQYLFSQNGRIILHNQLSSAVLHGVPYREGHREIYQKRSRLAKDGGRPQGQGNAVLWRYGRGTGKRDV